jgi:hypothetical protein
MSLYLLIPAVILLVFIIFQLRTLIPRILSFLAPGNRNLYFTDNPQPPIDEIQRQLVRPVIEKMEALGFKQLGIMVDKPPLWARGTREYSLASADRKVFASVGLRSLKPSYFFYTPFTGGQVVITGHNAFRNFRKDNFVTSVFSGEDTGEMLEAHRREVEEFVNKGFTPIKDYTQETAVQATHQYYNSPYPRQQLRVAGFINLLFILFCIFICALLFRGAFPQ